MISFLARLQSQFDRIPPELRGMLLILASTLAFSSMHAVIRHLSTDVHPLESAFFRNLFGLIVFLPFLVRHGLGILKTDRLKLHAIRGGIQACSMLMFFTALSLTSLAKLSAMSFTAPLFATIGAVLVLGERIRVRRVTALVVGFIGALVIIRPGIVEIDLGALLVVGSSAVWAVALLIIKVLTRTESSITITAYMSVFLTPFTFVAALFVWSWPSPTDYLWFLVMGVFGTLAHIAMTHAFKLADATVVLPLDFTRLIWASALGYLVFGEIPAIWTWLGGVIIFASTTYIAFREARLKSGGAASADD